MNNETYAITAEELDFCLRHMGNANRAQWGDEWAQALPLITGEPIKIDCNTSDGDHTFSELYDFRKAYNAALFNEWAACKKYSVHKSWRHHDGELCFGGGWFIVVAVLPQGQISNHYKLEDWDLFAVPEAESASFEYDGHTSTDVIERLTALTKSPHPPLPLITGEPVATVLNRTEKMLRVGVLSPAGMLLPDGTKLYTHAQPMQPITAEMVTGEMINLVAEFDANFNSNGLNVDQIAAMAMAFIVNTFNGVSIKHKGEKQ